MIKFEIHWLEPDSCFNFLINRAIGDFYELRLQRYCLISGNLILFSVLIGAMDLAFGCF